jgi:hypothetical protein
MISVEQAANYLDRYVGAYKAEHRALTTPPPDGAGFPEIYSSPYLGNGPIHCLLANDGAALYDASVEPGAGWHLGDGDLTRLIVGDQSGSIPDEVRRGEIPLPAQKYTFSVVNGPTFVISRIEIACDELIDRLTLGFVRHVPLPATPWDFWKPPIIRDIGFVATDLSSYRWFHYLELLGHGDPAAWEPRSAWVRARSDVRRDIAYGFTTLGHSGGTMSFGPGGTLEIFRDRLLTLEHAISGLQNLLDGDANASEQLFQTFLEEHPLLLDVYGEVIPRPAFRYPDDASPLGKTYVEPDFVIRRPGDRYVIVELERPAKPLATKQGHARAELTQPAFQIAEFRDFVLEHYDVLREPFPGINRDPQTMIIISRSTETSLPGRADVRRHMQLLREQLRADEILTYDDLLQRARTALARLEGLSPEPV